MPSPDRALTDAELLAIFHEPSADLSLLQSDEQQRLVTLTAPKGDTYTGPDTFWGGALRGAKEGVIGGAKGFLRGIMASPGNLVRGAVAGGQAILNDPLLLVPAHGAAALARNTVEGISRIPAAVSRAGADPEGWGADVGNLTGQTMLMMAGPKVVEGAPGAMVKTGDAMVQAGEALKSSEVPLGGIGYLAGHAVGSGPAGAAIGAGAPRMLTLTGRLLSKTGRAMTPPSVVDPYLPSSSGYVPGAAIPTAPGEALGPHAPPIDPYHPSTSGFMPADAIPPAAGQAVAGLRGPTQGTWTLLENGEWGITSPTPLTPGETIHVMNKAGVGKMVTVGDLIDAHTASVKGSTPAAAAAPTALTASPQAEGLSVRGAGGRTYALDPALQAAIRAKLQAGR